jgi:RecJ-like exonuclease
MAEIKQNVSCSYCGTKDSVTIITKQTKVSRTIKVTKCSFCKMQNGIKEILSRSV